MSFAMNDSIQWDKSWHIRNMPFSSRKTKFRKQTKICVVSSEFDENIENVFLEGSKLFIHKTECSV